MTPQPPPWSAVRAARDSLRTLVRPRFAGHRLDADGLGEMAAAAAAAVGSTHPAAAFETLRGWAGVELTLDRLDLIEWRLSGNVHRLKRGQPAPPWPAPEEWAIAQVTGVERAKKAFGAEERAGYRLDWLLLSGPAAGRPVETFWSSAQVRLRKTEFGYARRVRPSRNITRVRYDLIDPVELFRLRAQLLVRAKDGRPEAADVRGRTGTKAWNLPVLRRRLRFDHVCPKGLTHAELPCCRCPFGLDRCEAACRPVTLPAPATNPPPAG
jgi:hypothetical protein